MVCRALEIRTAYPADRAAPLAGVPKSTLHYWARTRLLVPSASEERVKLWSLDDLMALRIIDWLRTDKEQAIRTPTPEIRLALKQLHALSEEVWTAKDGAAIRVDRGGRMYFGRGDQTRTLDGQLVIGEVLDLLAPFAGAGGIQGPDLRRPRPHVRIVQGKLAGEPHIEDTRIETRALAALATRGFSPLEIVKMYPLVNRVQVEDALDLEQQLARNLSAA